MFLHLQSLLDLQSSPTVLPLSLSRHVETGRTQQSILCGSYDGPSKGCPHTPVDNMLWWIRGESNSRPQRLHYEGITTILLKLTERFQHLLDCTR